MAEHARAVLDGCLGLDGPVRDDLRDALLAVLLGRVADHVAATALVEVHVDVGHGDALGVEEPLEQQAVLHGIQLGDAQGVGDHRAGRRAATGADADAALLRVPDEVGRDEEVPGEPHLDDDADLVLGLLADVVGDGTAVAMLQAALDLLDQPRLLRLPLGDGEPRHQVGALGELDVAALRDEQGVVAGLRQLGPHLAHLRRRLDVEVAGVEAEPLGVVHRGARADAEQDVVGVGVGGVDVVQVVGGDEWQVEGAGDAEEVLAEPALDGQAVVHDLAQVVAGPEDVAEVGRCREGPVVVAGLEPPVDLAAGAAGGADEPGAVPLEQLPVEARLEVVALEAGQRGQPEEVVHADGVLGPQGHVGVALLAATGAGVVGRALVEAAAEVEGPPLEPALRGVVALEADDRVEAPGLRPLVELVGAVQVAVVGHRDGGHALSLDLVEQVGQPCGTVEHRVLGVHVQVHELLGRGHPLTLTFRADGHAVTHRSGGDRERSGGRPDSRSRRRSGPPCRGGRSTGAPHATTASSVPAAWPAPGRPRR